MAVRSRRFNAPVAASAGSVLVLATAPADRTAIIRHAVLENRTGATATLIMFVRTGAGVYITVARGSVANLNVLTLDQAFLVLNPGDELIAQVDSAVGTFVGYAAGALLLGAPT